VYHYLLCGLKVESDLAFPELTPWEGVDDRAFDIEFRLGHVEPLQTADAAGEKFQVQGKNRLVFLIEGVGRVLIEDGKRIVFNAWPDSDPQRVRLNFIGTVQSILWHQRGYIPLHASAVKVGERAIAVGGPTRGGKSAIAAALTARGCPLVADDFTVVDWAQKPPLVLPGYQKLRLWKDAAVELDVLDAVVAKAHPAMDKYVVAPAKTFSGEAPALTDLFLLAGERGEELHIERLRAVPSFQNLLAAVHMPDEARALGLQSQIFSSLNAIVSSVNIWQVTAPDDLRRVRDVADAVLRRVAEA
jgi:hypothetical protein